MNLLPLKFLNSAICYSTFQHLRVLLNRSFPKDIADVAVLGIVRTPARHGL